MPIKNIILIIINLFLWHQCYHLTTLEPLVAFLNIGQGDATLIQDHFNQIIIDTGPDETILNQINQFIPFNDKTIECIIITHPHQDHYQGLLHLLDYYHIDQIILPQIDGNDQAYQFLLEQIKQKNIPTIRAENFTQLQTDYIFIQFIYPFKYQIPQKVDDLNDISSTMLVYFDNQKITFTGDLSQTIENRLAEKYGPNLKSDILQVGHHGSKSASSEKFIQTVDPRLAIISVGENSFGHPHQNTLDILEQNKIEIWRTDLDGNYVFFPTAFLTN